MNIQNKKVLITGGGSGIGFGIAKMFSEQGAIVILVGRREEPLKNAVASLRNAHYIVADVSNSKDLKRLANEIEDSVHSIDILVNNAGISKNVSPIYTEEAEAGVRQEMEINYFAAVNLINLFVPSLKNKSEAAIINVSSFLAEVPYVRSATYCASKAALHSYTQTLRLHLKRENTNIEVYEVFPPLVDTDMTTGFDVHKLSPEDIADDLAKALATNKYEVRSGEAEEMYQAMLVSPEDALTLMNTKY